MVVLVEELVALLVRREERKISGRDICVLRRGEGWFGLD